MRFIRGISLFVVYPLLLLGIGFFAGLEFSGFQYGQEQDWGGHPLLLGLPVGAGEPSAYPGKEIGKGEEQALGMGAAKVHTSEIDGAGHRPVSENQTETGEKPGEDGPEGEVREAAASGDTLCVDTAYVLEEIDILHHTSVETTQRLPSKYVGMTREQFVEAMAVYEASPPLSELERGFVNLEVRSFARERVVVQMNYRYVQPSESFYLAVYDNEVVVYLEDRKTVYIETQIELDSLPEQLQRDIIQMMWIENEEKLYDFLENYSS